MPYEPHSPVEVDRSRNYVLIWFGSASTLFTFANLFIGMDNFLVVLAYGAMAGGLLQSALGRSGDEYFHSLCSIGHRWAITATAVFLMVLFILGNGDIARNAGYWLAAGEARSGASPMRVPFLENATVLSVLVSLAFYAGYAFAWLRDRAGDKA